jgi:hypothetical protein
MPLEFVGQQGFRWGGGPAHGGSEHFYNGTYVDVGTVPKGSKWSLNPVPRYDHVRACCMAAQAATTTSISAVVQHSP